MIPCKNEIDVLWESEAVREHVMLVTVFPTKIWKILKAVTDRCALAEKTICSLETNYQTLLDLLLSELTNKLGISKDTLLLTDILYDIYYATVLHDSIEGKINAWRTAYRISYAQHNGLSNREIDIFPNGEGEKKYYEKKDVIEILSETVEELNAWYELSYVNDSHSVIELGLREIILLLEDLKESY